MIRARQKREQPRHERQWEYDVQEQAWQSCEFEPGGAVARLDEPRVEWTAREAEM